MTLESIERGLGAAEPEARRIAIKRLEQTRGRDVSALVLRALGDEDWRVRKEAALVAPTLEPRAPVVEALVGALHDAVNVGLRNAAVEALIGIGQDSVPRVISEVPRLDADGRKLAVDVLGGLPDPRGARALAALLGDDDPNVRSSAAEALGRAGASGEDAREAATEALLGALVGKEYFLVLAALEALVKLEADVPWSALAPLAEDPVLRRHALAAGAAARAPEVVPALAAAIADPSATVARHAMALLSDMLAGTEEDDLVDRARIALRLPADARARVRAWAEDEDARTRGAALTALGLLREETDVQRLVDALADDAVAERAELALRLFGREVVGPVIAAGHHAAPAARGASISIMPSLAMSEKSVVAQLRAALASPQADVVAGALKALAVAGSAGEIPIVASLACSDDARVADAALAALFAIGLRHPLAARHARDTLEPYGVHAAPGCVLIDALARGGAGIEALDVAFLKTALAQGGVLARRAALEALATIGGQAAMEGASFALADEEREVVIAAVRAMGRLSMGEPLERLAAGTEDPVLIAAVLRALGEADPERLVRASLPLVRSAQPAIACAAVEALGSRRARRDDASSMLEDGIFAALDHADPEVVKLALTEIGTSPDARALARLGMSLDHAAPDVRRLAGELLGQAGGPGPQALLRARLGRERDPSVRGALTDALTARPSASAQDEDGTLSRRSPWSTPEDE